MGNPNILLILKSLQHDREAPVSRCTLKLMGRHYGIKPPSGCGCIKCLRQRQPPRTPNLRGGADCEHEALTNCLCYREQARDFRFVHVQSGGKSVAGMAKSFHLEGEASALDERQIRPRAILLSLQDHHLLVGERPDDCL